jgi:hypothetical protein
VKGARRVLFVPMSMRAIPMETKRFDLRTILTATTGRLLAEPEGENDNGIGRLYELLGWMTNDQPFTHQLPRFADECKPWLLRWFPELVPVSGSLQSLDKWNGKSDCPETGIFYWIAELKMMFPALKDKYDVPRIPQDDHEKKNPYDELVAMRGTDEGIVILNDGKIVE